MLNHPHIPGLNPTWSWHIIHLMWCSIQFVSIILRTFASIFTRDSCLIFFRVSLYGFSIRGLLISQINSVQFSSVQFSRSVVFDSLQPHELQHARPPCPSPTPRAYSNSCPSSRWCHLAFSSSVVPTPPAPNSSQHQGLFQWVNFLHEVAKVLEFQLQHQSFQWTLRTDLL